MKTKKEKKKNIRKTVAVAFSANKKQLQNIIQFKTTTNY